MMPERRTAIRNALVIAPIMLAGVCLLVLAGCAYTGEPKLPSDAELIEYFRENRADFETLVSMLNEHKQLVQLHQDGSYDEKIIDPKEVPTYQALLRHSGLDGQGVTSYADHDFHFVRILLWHWNRRPLSNRKRIIKGYVYSTRKLGSPDDNDEIVEDHWPWGAKGLLKDTLDDATGGKLGPAQRWYRHLEGDWYLFVENLSYELESND